MRAVNLIPPDLRSGSDAPGRSGPAVNILIGVLGVAVVLVSAWTLAGRQVADRQSELNRTRAEAAEAVRHAGLLEPYAKFSELRKKRVETVTSLSRSRFNWPHALREVSRVTPKDVWLTQMLGTVAPGVQVDGGATTGAGSLRTQIKSPAVEITGCTTAQDNVARYLAELRRIDGVTRVSLASSEKLENATGGGAPVAGSGAGSDCRRGNDRFPKFDLVVFFERSTATAASGVPGQAPAAPAAASGATSSSSTSSSSTSTAGSTK